MISKARIEALRQDPKHYKCGGMVYVCPEDPYVVRPKRVAWMGWTFNFAHAAAWWYLLGAVLLTTVPLLAVIGCRQSVEAALITISLEVLLLCVWMRYESTKYHRGDKNM